MADSKTKYFAKRAVRFGQLSFAAGEEVTGVPESRLASCGRFVETEAIKKQREAATQKVADDRKKTTDK